MSLAPLISPEIRGVEGSARKIGGACAAPGCSSPAQQRHHLWSRGYLRGQPYEWVEVHGVTLQNSIGLCVPCHLAVTGGIGGHRAHIRYDVDKGIFEWWARMSGDGQPERWVYVGLLKQRGFTDGQPEAKRIRREEGLCPECGKPLEKEHKHEPGPRRKVTTWGMLVPDDAEVGSDVLDDQIDQLAVMLGFGEAKTRLKRYHVVAVVLSWTLMNTTQFLADLEEAEWFGSVRASEDAAHPDV